MLIYLRAEKQQMSNATLPSAGTQAWQHRIIPAAQQGWPNWNHPQVHTTIAQVHVQHPCHRRQYCLSKGRRAATDWIEQSSVEVTETLENTAETLLGLVCWSKEGRLWGHLACLFLSVASQILSIRVQVLEGEEYWKAVWELGFGSISASTNGFCSVLCFYSWLSLHFKMETGYAHPAQRAPVKLLRLLTLR